MNNNNEDASPASSDTNSPISSPIPHIKLENAAAADVLTIVQGTHSMEISDITATTSSSNENSVDLFSTASPPQTPTNRPAPAPCTPVSNRGAMSIDLGPKSPPNLSKQTHHREADVDAVVDAPSSIVKIEEEAKMPPTLT